MKINGWWFENKQNKKEICQPKWFTPRTHFAVYLENDEFIFPLKLSIHANKNSKEMFSAEYEINGLKDTAEYEVMQKGNALLFKGFADGVQGLPSSLMIQVISNKQIRQSIIPLTYATISGKTMDFQGNPFPSAVVFQRKFFGGKTPSIGVWSNAKGEYSVTIPTGGYGSFYVDDNSYNRTTLENWSWNMHVDCDATHNFKVGNGEVYNLTVTEEENECIVAFRPMVLPSIKKVETNISIDGENYLLVDIQPDIEKDDLSVSIDGQSVPILSVERDYEKIIDGDKKIALIIYKIKIDKPETIKGGELLILEYQTRGQYKTYAQGRTQIWRELR